MIGKKNFHDIQFLNGKVLISLPNCKTIKSSLDIFILNVNACNKRKKLKEAESMVGQTPIFRKSSIKLRTIRIIGSLKEGEIVIDYSTFVSLIINLSK